MSALPSAAAHAAAATACTRPSVVQDEEVHSLPIMLLSSFVTDDDAGWVARPVPSTRVASALLTVAVPAPVPVAPNVEPVSVRPNNCGCRVELLTAALQY